MRKGLWMVGLALAIMAFAVPAQALPVIDFGTGAAGPGGAITKVGSLVTGTGVLVDILTVTGAPLNNGPYDLTGTGVGLVGSTAVLNFGYGPAVNYVNIVGGVPGMGIPNGTTLLAGTFNTFNFSPGSGVWGTGPDTKSELLLLYVGLPVNQPFAFFAFTIGTDATGGGGFTAYSTDVLNTAVPEPGSMLLLGSGLVALAGAVRRRLKK